MRRGRGVYKVELPDWLLMTLQQQTLTCPPLPHLQTGKCSNFHPTTNVLKVLMVVYLFLQNFNGHASVHNHQLLKLFPSHFLSLSSTQ